MEQKEEKNISLEYEITVTDKQGKEVYKSGKQASKSYVKQFMQIMKAQMGGSNVPDVKDTAGTLRFVSRDNYRADAPDGDDRWGIQVGAGDTPVTNDDYALDDKILHGSDAGKLQYGAMAFYDIVEESGYVKFTMSRTFFNGSGASIDVKEIGLVSHTDDYYYLVVRDVLASPVTVNAGNTLTVQYTLKTTA